MSKWNINWTKSCSDVIIFSCVILSLLLEVSSRAWQGVCLAFIFYICERLPYCKCSGTGRLLGAYNLRVATPRALVQADDKTSGDPRSWVMTRSAGRLVVAPRGGGLDGRVGIEGRTVREPRRRKVKLTSEPKGQGNNQGVEEYDGKGGTIVYTRWIKKMESVQDMSGCRDNQKVNQKNPEKQGNRGEPSKDRNGREENKRTRTGKAFATTANPDRRENMGHFAKDCRVVPRNVNPINARNLTVRTCYECRSTDNFKAACPRAFMLGAEEARQDPNIVMGIEPSALGFSYEIEIASGQLVKIDKEGEEASYTLYSNHHSSHEPCSQGSRCGICRGCGLCEEMQILLSELIFTFSCELGTSSGVPSNFDDGDTTFL
nr:reverse transcriptase domain-containing protein [Tanacetum cinerariifolium]